MAAAHRAALDAGSRTVAVIDTGIGRVYLAENRGLQDEMAVEHGRQVILTEQVVTRNQWAQRLVGRPGVRVANSVDDAMHIVEQVVTVWDDIGRLVTP